MIQLELVFRNTEIVKYEFSGLNNLDERVEGTGLFIVSPGMDPYWAVESYLIQTHKLERRIEVVIYDLS